jgi:hypothetical protein
MAHSLARRSRSSANKSNARLSHLGTNIFSRIAKAQAKLLSSYQLRQFFGWIDKERKIVGVHSFSGGIVLSVCSG